MLILLPPSEGKTAPTRGRPLDLTALTFPALAEARRQVLDALVALCATPDATGVLGLGPTQQDEVARNARVREAPTVRADRLYTGVLYDALGLATLDPAAKARASRWLVISSSLFGAVRPGDRIPAYRLAGGVTLPALGTVAGHWRGVLDPPMREAAGDGLIVDLRSGTYAAFWRPAPDLAARVATVRVLQEQDGRRSVVSHFNKATKGRIVRALLADGARPRTPSVLAEQLRDLGWRVEVGEPGRGGRPLDVIVSEL